MRDIGDKYLPLFLLSAKLCDILCRNNVPSKTFTVNTKRVLLTDEPQRITVDIEFTGDVIALQVVSGSHTVVRAESIKKTIKRIRDYAEIKLRNGIRRDEAVVASISDNTDIERGQDCLRLRSLIGNSPHRAHHVLIGTSAIPFVQPEHDGNHDQSR